MFTGLIQEVGKIDQIRPIKEGKELVILCPPLIPHIKIDDSVAVNGVCLTVVEFNASSFKVQCVSTTLQKSTLGFLKKGEEVNLELALRVGDRLGGHIVQGHVNGMGQIAQMQKTGQHILMGVRFPLELGPYLVKEGSICLDGISLTIADRKKGEITVAIIPHTLQNTHLKNKKTGDSLNIEVDILAKYLEGLLQRKSTSTLDLSLL